MRCLNCGSSAHHSSKCDKRCPHGGGFSFCGWAAGKGCHCIIANLPEASGSGNIAAAGYVPGMQSYLKRKQTIWSKSRVARDLELQGFTRVHGVGH